MIQEIHAAYIEAVYFTDTGDTGQPPEGAELTPLFLAQSYTQCRDFWYAIKGEPLFLGLSAEQLGHDLWLTRNGHGAGFWSRPGVYGGEAAKWLDRIARAMGSHDAEWVEDWE